MDAVGYPAPLCLVADTPDERRWQKSPNSTVFSFPWKPACPSSSSGDRYSNQRCDYEDGASSSEPNLSSRRDPEDAENITLEYLLNYCAKIGAHACSNRLPKRSGGNLSEMIEQYVTLKGRKDAGSSDALLTAARESRTLATEICKLLQSIDNRNISEYLARNAIITDELARQIYVDTVPPAYMAARDLSKYLETRDRRAVFV